MHVTAARCLIGSSSPVSLRTCKHSVALDLIGMEVEDEFQQLA